MINHFKFFIFVTIQRNPEQDLLNEDFALSVRIIKRNKLFSQDFLCIWNEPIFLCSNLKILLVSYIKILCSALIFFPNFSLLCDFL